MDNLQRIMLLNGLLVILIASISGFMLLFQLVGGFEVWPGHIIEVPVYGSSDGWVRAHTGGLLNGVLVMLVGLSLPHLKLTDVKNKIMAYGFCYCAWSFTAFYWIGNAVSNRALTFGDNPLGESSLLSVIGFLPGLPSVFIVVILLAIAISALLRKN
jgi:hypothetical protein